MAYRSIQTVDNPGEVMLWFDLDDTLWDMSGNSRVCLRNLYKEKRLDRWFESEDQWLDIYHQVNDELWRQYGRGDISRDYLRVERFARPLRIRGASSGTAGALSRDFDGIYLSQLGQQQQLMPHAREVLQYLYDTGYRMGIVSNGFHEVQHDKMKSSGIDRFFSHIILSEDAGANKPSPLFFEFAAREGDSQGLRNIIIGDNPSADIDGAIDFGWEAVWLRNDTAATAHPAAMTIDSLCQLREFL